MPVIETLLITGGHAFERDPFFQMIGALCEPAPGTKINWTHVEHPAAEALLHSVGAGRFDVIVWYDMPGVTFTNASPPFAQVDPTAAYKAAFMALLDAGKPMVFLHHAIL